MTGACWRAVRFSASFFDRVAKHLESSSRHNSPRENDRSERETDKGCNGVLAVSDFSAGEEFIGRVSRVAN